MIGGGIKLSFWEEGGRDSSSTDCDLNLEISNKIAHLVL